MFLLFFVFLCSFLRRLRRLVVLGFGFWFDHKLYFRINSTKMHGGEKKRAAKIK